MSIRAPSFIDSPYFVVDDAGWHLKEGAPEQVVKEFNEYMEAYQQALEKGAVL